MHLLIDSFNGDAAIPNINYDIELQMQKAKKTFKGDIEEILEGLQIEEEGMVEIYKAKQKHDENVKKAEEKDKEKSEIFETFDSGKKDFKKKKTSQRQGKRNKFNVPVELDDNFDQVEPKYFLIHEENEKESSRARIQNERKRRIEHTGDSAKFEILEAEKIQGKNSSKVMFEKKEDEKIDLDDIADESHQRKRLMKKRKTKFEKNSEGEIVIRDDEGVKKKVVKLRHRNERRLEKPRIQRRGARGKGPKRR